MTTTEPPPFGGFPAASKGTAIPNLFFSSVLPRLHGPGSLLAFLWAARLAQARKQPAHFCTEHEIWTAPGASDAFQTIGGGYQGLRDGLRECVDVGALLTLEVASNGVNEVLYFLNNPAARRAIARARAGELALRPQALVVPPAAAVARPGIFRLYEENIGTITPIVGERLIAAEEQYPSNWIEEAFREAAEHNVRSWRYIERILQRWEEEGRQSEATGPDTPERRRQRFLGGGFGSLIRER